MIKPEDPQDTELGALYRAATRETPSAGLDARILAAARDAATPSRELAPTPLPTSWVQRWRIPVALAATVLMTSTLTLLVREHDIDGVESVVPKPAPTERRAKAAPSEREAKAAPSERKSETASPAAQPAPRQADAGPERAAPSDAESSAGAAEMQSAPATARASAESASRSMLSDKLERRPQQWLEEIRQLRRQGRAADAEARLAEFRKRYPQFPLPDDMKQP